MKVDFFFADKNVELYNNTTQEKLCYTSYQLKMYTA